MLHSNILKKAPEWGKLMGLAKRGAEMLPLKSSRYQESSLAVNVFPLTGQKNSCIVIGLVILVRRCRDTAVVSVP